MRPKPDLGDALDAVDHREHADQREGGARDVEPAGVRIAELRQEPRADDQKQHHHRDTHEEDRSPPEALEEQATDERADRRADRVARDPETDRYRALPRVVE